MNITILGTGMVAKTLASRLNKLNHKVFMETRDVDVTKKRASAKDPNDTFDIWLEEQSAVSLSTFGTSVSKSDIIINATNGKATLDVLGIIGKDPLAGKILIDVSNPLDFSNGMPPSLFVSNTDSLAEQIQRTYPKTMVVKSLNTMNAEIMLNPAILAGNHTVFMSGNAQEAKHKVAELLEEAGWKPQNIIDLGDISTARGTEQLLPVWIRLWGAIGTSMFNFNIVKA